MNTREYIESGVLDLYVSGLLSVEEMRDVELKACQFQEIKTELSALQLAFEMYAQKHAMVPPPGLKERIMKAIESSGKSDPGQGLPQGKVVEIQQRRNPAAWILAAASIALLLVAGYFAWYFNSQYKEAQSAIAGLQQQQSEMQKTFDQLQLALADKENNLQLLADPNTVKVAMKGTPGHPESLALIYWNTSSGQVYLDVKSLPPATPDKQYQLWYINPEKIPVSAGVFDPKPGQIVLISQAPAAIAFAVTLEPRGGSVSPTLDQMYVIGNVSS